jgi:hypothetical protein
MIYLLATSDDSTARHFAREAPRFGARVEWVDLAEAVEGRWQIDVDGDATFRLGGRRVIIPAGASVYARLVLPDGCTDDPDLSLRARRLLTALASWLEVAGGRVANRPGHALDNGSKPLHEAWLARAGFLVPPSLTSADPDRLRDFAESQPVVVKTISGIRADCRSVTPKQLRNFRPEQGPIHLQHVVKGQDVRVHVVGDQVIPVGIRSRRIDYRIAPDATYQPLDSGYFPHDLARCMVEATRETGLAFAGWDFKIGKEDGRFYALEANPMPGYHLYDLAPERRITRTLVEHLLQ